MIPVADVASAETWQRSIPPTSRLNNLPYRLLVTGGLVMRPSSL
jgi:hypothetical protein